MSGYGLLVSLGVLAGTLLIRNRARVVGWSKAEATDLVFWSVVAGLVGARLLFVVVEWRYFLSLCIEPELVLPDGVACLQGGRCLPGQECDGVWCRNVGDCWAAFKVWFGGWVFLGGVAGGAGGAVVWLRIRGRSVAQGLSLLTLGLPVGHALGRVGCWIRGCCFGKEFSVGTGLPGRHPVQLYEAAGELLVLALVVREFIRVSGRADTRDAPWRWWAVPSSYLLFYGVLRGGTELFRGDLTRGFLTVIHMPSLSGILGVCPDLPLFLSTSQLIAAAMVLAGATGLWWTRRAR